MVSFMPSGRKMFCARIVAERLSAQAVYDFAEQFELMSL